MGENGALADVAAAAGYGGRNGGGFGYGGDGAWWLIILFLFAFMGNGWGGNRGGFGGGSGDLYPWINNSQNINDGFRDQMLTSQVMGIQNAVTSGFGDVQNALCGGYSQRRYPMGRSYNDGRSYDDGYSEQMRAANGQYRSGDEYSGHSVDDRVIAMLEEMAGRASSDYERDKIRQKIEMLHRMN